MDDQIVPGVIAGVFNIGGNGHGLLRLVVGRYGEIGLCFKLSHCCVKCLGI